MILYYQKIGQKENDTQNHQSTNQLLCTGFLDKSQNLIDQICHNHDIQHINKPKSYKYILKKFYHSVPRIIIYTKIHLIITCHDIFFKFTAAIFVLLSQIQHIFSHLFY